MTAIDGTSAPLHEYDRLADETRVRALERSGLLDAEDHAAFDRLTRLAARLVGGEAAVLALIGAERQWIKSRQSSAGPVVGDTETPLSHSFCRHVVGRDAPLLAPDARDHHLLRRNPAIQDYGVLAYAGVPVRDPDGQPLGSLCVVDSTPREWPANTLATLTELSELVTTELSLRRLAREAQARAEALEQVRALVEATEDAIIGKGLDGTIFFWNSGAESLYGYTREEAIDHPIQMLAVDPSQLGEFDAIHAAIGRGETVERRETRRRRRDGSIVEVEVRVSPLRDKAGRIIGASTIARDISARREAERAERRLARLLEEAQELANLSHWELDVATGAVSVGDRLHAIFGTDRDAAAPADSAGFARLIHPDDFPRYADMLERVRASGEPGQTEFRILRPDGVQRIVQSRARVRRDEDGSDTLFGTLQDVTELRELEREARRARDLFSGVLDAATETGIVAMDAAGRITLFNPGAERMLGCTAARALGRAAADFLVPGDGDGDDRAATLARFVRAARAGHPVSRDCELRSPLGGSAVAAEPALITASVTVTCMRDDRGSVSGYIAVVRDVSDARRAERARREAERRFAAAFEHAPIGVALTGLDGSTRGTFLQVNPALTGMLGYAPGELDGVELVALTHADDLVSTTEALDRVTAGETFTTEQRLLHRNGSSVWVLISATPIPPDDVDIPEYCVTQVVDITERRRFEGQLRHLAEHDPLTGLLNRQRFEVELERVLAESRRYDRRGAVLMLDLDGFKTVNDRFGHAAGDELVRRIGALLRKRVRTSDVVARIGGDEFAIILLEARPEDAIVVAESILGTIRTRGAVVNEGVSARVSASIGITTFEPSLDVGADELMVQADMAMYEAKRAGRDRWAAGDTEAARLGIARERRSWIERLRHALDHDGFELFAQPIRSTDLTDPPCFELLLRLRDEDGQLLPPGAFLLNAERFDLLGQIDRWVLRRAIGLLHEHAAVGNDVSLTVNLSGSAVCDPALVADLEAMLAARPIPAGRLIIEVSETNTIINLERAQTLASELRRLGCRFAIDDFGAAFAAFTYLKHLEFDLLKIDGEFIQSLTASPADQLVVRAVVEFAERLGARTVAEFVPDAATVDLLDELGVSLGQGFYLGEPAPVAAALPPLV